MSEREDKTLKERIDDAREALKWIADRPHSHALFQEALTALEERVKELEKKQATHEISAVYCPSKQEIELTWRDLETGNAEGLLVKVKEVKG